MRLTTKGRFAVTAMIDLALRQGNGPVTLAAISQRQRISLSYLEQLFGKLRRHELVESRSLLSRSRPWGARWLPLRFIPDLFARGSGDRQSDRLPVTNQ